MRTYADEDFAALSLREQFRVLAPFAESDPEVAEWMVSTEALLAENPLLGFEPHASQRDFIRATTAVVAAFAGNRFGKSTALGVCALREALPAEVLPEILRSSKRFEGPTQGWILVPTEDKIDDSFRPAFQKWCPPSEFQGGSWGKAFKGDTNLLRFKNGSTIQFKTYKQDPSTLGGAALHYVGYDEPPPRKHREECMWRLGDHGGYEMFAMTPLDTNTAYVRRVIWKKRESPDITVVTGSVHDNPTLNKATIARAIGATTDIYIRAREFGEFVSVGGLIYPDFERCVLPESDPRLVKRGGQWIFDPEFIRSLEVVVGIDPGIRNAGFSWVGFDRDLTGHLFEEGLLQDKHAKDYVRFINEQNKRWGLKDAQLFSVVDPAAIQRAQANGMTVLSEINKEGLFPNLGQNDHELGFGQMRARMQMGRLLVAPSCVLHRDQADEYAAKEPKEGEDDSKLVPIEVGAHCLASLRYVVMERFWDATYEEEAPNRNLGWVPGGDMPADPFSGARRGSDLPMGSMM